jgi:hypothetical protein
LQHDEIEPTNGRYEMVVGPGILPKRGYPMAVCPSDLRFGMGIQLQKLAKSTIEKHLMMVFV